MRNELFDLKGKVASPAAMAASGLAWRAAWPMPAPTLQWSAATRRSWKRRLPSLPRVACGHDVDLWRQLCASLRREQGRHRAVHARLRLGR